MKQIPIGGVFSTSDPSASLDVRYGPYASRTEAHEKLTSIGQNVLGLTVGIANTDGTIIGEYWYKNGTGSVSDLVNKNIGGGVSDHIYMTESQYQKITPDENMLYLLYEDEEQPDQPDQPGGGEVDGVTLIVDGTYENNILTVNGTYSENILTLSAGQGSSGEGSIEENTITLQNATYSSNILTVSGTVNNNLLTI